MRRLLPCIFAGLLGHQSVAAACSAPYTATQLGSDLTAMSEALRSGDMNTLRLRAPGEALVAGLPCMDAPVAPVVLASIYRYAGLSFFVSDDTVNAERWFRSALELDPTFDWDVAEVPVGHPVRTSFELQREQAGKPPVDAAGGKRLAIPEGYRLTVDGRPLREPMLTSDRPHFVQLIKVEGNAVEEVWVVDGAALPLSLLTDADAPAGETTFAGSSLIVEKIERTRPPMKTPALISGGAFIAGGIALYAMSFGAHDQWEAATTSKALAEKRSLTNGLVLGAASALTLGAGMTWVGVSLDGGGVLGWNLKF